MITRILFCIASLMFTIPAFAATAPTHNDEQIATQVKQKTAKEIQDKYGVTPLLQIERKGTTDEWRKWLSLNLELPIAIDIPIARQLIVEWTELYLKNINEQQALKGALPEFPLTSKYIEINCLVSRERKQGDSVKIFGVSDGNIQYLVFSRGHFKGTYQESYQEAMNILTQQTQPAK